MVSFFGLKVGGKKKKADSKPAAKEPERPKRIDQNTLGEGQFFGVNSDYKSVFNSNGSIRSGSRAGTPGGIRSPYTQTRETHNLAAVSMFDLGTASRSGSQASFRPPDLKAHASDMNLAMRFGANNESSTSLAIPPNFSSGPPSRIGSRPGTPNGRNKAWVNPLDVHFARGTPTAPAPPKVHPLAQSSIELPPPTPTKSDAGSVFGEEADDMVDAVMASVKKQEEESAKEKERARELEKKKETARLELERLERQKSNESMLPKSPVEREHQLSFFDRPQNSPTLPGPMFRGNIDTRPSSRGGPRQDSPISPTGGQSPTIHQGPPPTGPPTQSLPQPPGQGPPRQGPRGPNEIRGPQQSNTPPYSPNHNPTESSRGGIPVKAGQGPSRNAAPQDPRSSPPGPRNGPAPQHNGPQSPHLRDSQQRGSPPPGAGPYRPPAGPHNAGPRNGPPGPSPRGPGFNGSRAESPMRRPMAPGQFRSESPARRPMGSGGRSESPGPRFMGNNGPRSESPEPRFRGNNGFRLESPRRMPMGNNSPGLQQQHGPGMGPRPNGPGSVSRQQIDTASAHRPQVNTAAASSPQVEAAPELPTPVTEAKQSLPLISTLISPTPSTARSSVDDEFWGQLTTPPVIRDVSAKRDTLTQTHRAEQSLSMKIEELEKTILSQHVLKPRPPNLVPAPVDHRISTTSSCYSSDMPDLKDDEDDNDKPILSIQPAPLRVPSPLPPTVAAAVTSPVQSPGSPIRAPKAGQRPRRPGLEEYGVSSSQLSSPRARIPTPASATLTSPTDSGSIRSFHTANNSPPSRSTSPFKPQASLPILAPSAKSPATSPVEPPKPIPFIDTGFQFDFGTAAGPLTPDSSHWHISSPTTESAPGVAIAAVAPPPPPAISEPSTEEEALPKFTRPNVPPRLKLKFDFSPDASSCDPTLGKLTPPLYSAPPMIAVNDGRPSTSASHSTLSNNGLQASPQLISQFPNTMKDENRLSFMGIGVARGPSIREVRRPDTSHGTGQGDRMVDSFGTGFI